MSTDTDSSTEYAETTPRTGIARCAPLDGQTAPYTVHGVAIGPDDVTNGANGEKIWPPEALRAAAESLEGVPLNKNHDSKRVESVVGEVVAAEYEPDVGVIFEAEVDDEAIATKIARGRLEVSPHARHRADGEDDEGRLIVSDIRFLDLAVVPRGASPSNYVESGESEMLAALSASDVASMFTDAANPESMPAESTTETPEPAEQTEQDPDNTDAEAELEADDVESEADEADVDETGADEPDVAELEAELEELRAENAELQAEIDDVRADYAATLAESVPAFEADELAEKYTYTELSEKIEAIDGAEMVETQPTSTDSDATGERPAPRTGSSEAELSTSSADNDEEIATLEAKIERYDSMGWDAAKDEAKSRLEELNA